MVDTTALHTHTGQHPAGAIIARSENAVSVLLTNGQVIHINNPGMPWLGPNSSLEAQARFIHRLRIGDVVHLSHTKTNDHWQLIQQPKVQGCIVSLNPDTGAIEALDGGYHFKLSAFNRATQALRQPGSSIKPFIYSTALEHGFSLATMINDAPIVQYDAGTQSLWRPQNDSRHFYGPTSLRNGLVHSRNLVSIRLVRIIGLDTMRQQLSRFGFKLNRLPNSLSLALGTGLVTPLQLTGSYATFANTGYKIEPYVIQKVIDQDGHLIYDHDIEYPPPYQHVKINKRRVISEDNAFLIADALRTVIAKGTGRFAKKLHRTYLAGKTGTTNKRIDGWFVGFSRHHVAGVWVGFDNNASLKEYAAKTALPIWTDFMGQILHNQPDIPFIIPANITAIRINSKNGLRANENTLASRFEYFRRHNIPPKDKPHSQPTMSDLDDDTPSHEDLF